MKEITIIIVDDHPLFRQGVADALSLEKGFKVIALATNGREGMDLIRDWSPAIAIVDVNLPEMNGQQLTRQVVAEKIPTKVLLLTAYDDKGIYLGYYDKENNFGFVVTEYGVDKFEDYDEILDEQEETGGGSTDAPSGSSVTKWEVPGTDTSGPWEVPGIDTSGPWESFYNTTKGPANS